LGPADAVQRPDDLDVLPAGELPGESGRQLQQGRDPGPGGDRALVRDEYAGDELQQGGLAGAVAADHADRLAGLDPEGGVAQRPDLVRPRPPPAALHEQVPQLEVAPPRGEEPDADAVCLDDGHYSSFSTAGSRRVNTSAPTTRNSKLPTAAVTMR